MLYEFEMMIAMPLAACLFICVIIAVAVMTRNTVGITIIKREKMDADTYAITMKLGYFIMVATSGCWHLTIQSPGTKEWRTMYLISCGAVLCCHGIIMDMMTDAGLARNKQRRAETSNGRATEAELAQNVLRRILRTKDWNNVRRQIKKMPKEEIRELYPDGIAIEQIDGNMPYDIGFTIAKTLSYSSSIYNMFDVDAINGRLEAFVAFEMPSEYKFTVIALHAIKHDMKDLAEGITVYFPLAPYQCALNALARKIGEWFPFNGHLLSYAITRFRFLHAGAIADSILYCMIQAGVRMKVDALLSNSLSKSGLNNPACRRAIATALSSYKTQHKDIDLHFETFPNDHKIFVHVFAYVIATDVPSLCRHKDILDGSDIFLNAVIEGNVSFMNFAIHQCPQMLQVGDGRYIRCAAERKNPAALAILLGVDPPETDVNLCPNKLDAVLEEALGHISSSSPDNTSILNANDTVECACICIKKFPKSTHAIVKNWIKAMSSSFPNRTTCISTFVMRRIIEELDIDLSMSRSACSSTGAHDHTYGMMLLSTAILECSRVPTKLTSTGALDIITNRCITFSVLLDGKCSKSNMAAIKDRDGRLPLHFACAHGLN